MKYENTVVLKNKLDLALLRTSYLFNEMKNGQQYGISRVKFLYLILELKNKPEVSYGIVRFF
jgi:hypothetical protein